MKKLLIFMVMLMMALPIFSQKILTIDGQILTWNSQTLTFVGEEFNPLTISVCRLWLDAADASTIIKDPSDYISQWNDKSVNGWNMTQGTFDNRPRLISNAQNGKDVVRFDGVNDYLETTNILLSQPITIFVVLNVETVSGLINPMSSNATDFYWSISTNEAIPAPTILYSGINMTTGIHLSQLEYNGVSSRIVRDGVEIATGNAGDNGMQLLTTLGGYNGSAYFYTGDICEFIIYNKILSTEETEYVENGLINKWNLPL